MKKIFFLRFVSNIYDTENISQKENKGITFINQQMKNLLKSLDYPSEDWHTNKLMESELTVNEIKFEEKYLKSNYSQSMNKERKFEEKYLNSNAYESIHQKNNELNERSFSVAQETNFILEKEEAQNNFRVLKENKKNYLKVL